MNENEPRGWGLLVGEARNGGSAGAQAELAGRLQEAMTGRGMTQKELATRAELSRGAVSNILSGKNVPHLDTLDKIADALGVTGQARTDLYRLRERADRRGRRLDGYLHAALSAARNHPYPGVLPGTARPLLKDVHVGQKAVLRRDSNSPRGTRESLSAEQALSGGRMCLILGGPGGGKSSLLRTHLIDLIERWLAGRGASDVPVLVPAAALGSVPLNRALASVVSAELASHGLVDELSAEFFANSPRPGVRWLVLIDGLDEIADSAARQRVLRAVDKVAHGKDAARYRFVVATRPLPEAEFRELDPRHLSYDLLPFATEDLTNVASVWFGSLLPDADAAAERFVQMLARAHLLQLARIPLMAAMLCQLHAAVPDRPLPSNRSQIYRDFIALLHKRQHTLSPAGIQPQQRAGVERYGLDAREGIERVLDHLHDLISRLAAERRSGNTSPALDIVELQPEARCPKRVPPDEWRAFLNSCLLGSGLLTDRAGKPVFLHQTLLEYLAARHAARDPHVFAQALHQVFDRPTAYRRSTGPPAGVSARPWHRRWYWQAPGDLSYVGFLIDRAQDSNPEAAASGLTRLASPRAGLQGCQFISAQIQLGTIMIRETADAAADLCHDLACDITFSEETRAIAACTLVGLRDQRAAGLCNDFARDTTLRDVRLAPAWTLVELGDPRGLDVCHDVARDTTLDSALRLAATWKLMERGDPRGLNVCHQFARDTTLDSFHRLAAAWKLATLDAPRAADLCHGLAHDTTLDSQLRLAAAWKLATLGDTRTADLCHRLAHDTTLDSFHRLAAAWKLVKVGDTRTADLCQDLAHDTTLEGQFRLMAAWKLVELGDPRTPDLACDIASNGDLWLATSWKLTELSDTRADHLARSTTLDGDPKLTDVRTLMWPLPFPISVQFADHKPPADDWDPVGPSFESTSRPQAPSWLQDIQPRPQWLFDEETQAEQSAQTRRPSMPPPWSTGRRKKNWVTPRRVRWPRHR
ncbi:helix-turn-helix domain-containing protein [Streptomyces chartreusis]|uniref:helix-turn-helix domain-containing protein n=1 Tax=Streptomyces chartreusis TaxID=1969 RepID=UPI0036AEB6E8